MIRASVQNPQENTDTKLDDLKTVVEKSWSLIAPTWPLKNMVAANPLTGFESIPFEEALNKCEQYFQRDDMPKVLQTINEITIKWLQAYFDEGQASINMPRRQLGLLQSIVRLLKHDGHIKNTKRFDLFMPWLSQPEILIKECLFSLNIPSHRTETFLTLMLTTLPGWASYIQYQAQWCENPQYPISQKEYTALRVLLTALIWQDAVNLLDWHDAHHTNATYSKKIEEIIKNEVNYQTSLLKKIKPKDDFHHMITPEAQLVFCIDPRSEPMRRAIESQGPYETFGFAGFFGLDLCIRKAHRQHDHASCPVLVKPRHSVLEKPITPTWQDNYQRLQTLKKLYQSLKYTFTTPFGLAETAGFWAGLWMTLKSVLPLYAQTLKKSLHQQIHPDAGQFDYVHGLAIDEKVSLVKSALKSMGMTTNFAPLVVICAHGSSSQNNAFAALLNCGACAGHHGDPNARIFAELCNDKAVRQALSKNNIHIPDETWFMAAKHNTTTDEVKLYDTKSPETHHQHIQSLSRVLSYAQLMNNTWRMQAFDKRASPKKLLKHTKARSVDWAEVRPEWGLARNCAMVIGPRWLTEHDSLEGRVFLHSYDWADDHNAEILKNILLAPMQVAHWINAQYLFSTLDNVAFGAGSKVTQNITGKIGVMQGCASDLMHGLPLQSVNKNHEEAYHEPMRLLTVVLAPRNLLERCIFASKPLQQQFGNGWIHLIAVDPDTFNGYQLDRDLQWQAL